MVSTDSDSSLLLPTSSGTTKKPPQDKYHLAYITYFILGFGYLLPWNAFITAVDYFSYLYPQASVDRIFAVVYMLVGLFGLTIIILYSHKSHAYVRINLGLALFVLSLLVVPLIDVFYVKGRVGFYGGFYVTVGSVALSGVADALVQGSIVGSAGELPQRYMQAVIAGTAASGIAFEFLSFLLLFSVLFWFSTFISIWGLFVDFFINVETLLWMHCLLCV
jgi:equilibrative nucleoside transporter 1/2/3